jgi:pimeloyl-ACP methyl ester carboxylesterase
VLDPTAITVAESREVPRYFQGPEGALFGIVSSPMAPELGISLVVAGGGWFGTSMGRNRLIVQICRRAAVLGYHAMRFDYRGVGESEGTTTRFEVDRWFPEDMAAACRAMSETKPGGLVLAGWCFGARAALEALQAAPDLRGAILVSPPIRRSGTVPWGMVQETMDLRLWRMVWQGLHPRLLRGLLTRDYRRSISKAIRKRWKAAAILRGAGSGGNTDDGWVSPGFLSTLEELVKRRVPVLLIYGTADAEYLDFHRALTGRLGKVLEHGATTLSLVTLEGEVSSAGSIAMQDATLDLIGAWLRDLTVSTNGVDEGRTR